MDSQDTIPTPTTNDLISTVDNQQESKIPAPASKKSPLLFILVGILTLLITLCTLSYAIAYEKISIGNETVQNNIASFVQSLPFTTKTNKFLLLSSFRKQKKISKHDFKISFEISTDRSIPNLNTNKISGELSGYANYQDINHPEFDVRFTGIMGFQANAKKKGNILYFKIDSLPDFLLTQLSISPDKLQKITSTWVSHDTSPLQSEARRELSKNNINSSSLSNESVIQTLDFLQKNKQLIDSGQISQDQIDGAHVYKLTWKLSDDQIDSIITHGIENSYGTIPSSTFNNKPSDVLSDFVFSIYIDRKTHYTRRLALSFTATNNQQSVNTLSSLTNGNQINQVNFRFEANINNFGKDKIIETPQSVILIEQFYNLIFDDSGGLFGRLNPSQQFAQANNAKRKNDVTQILNAIHQYISDNKGIVPQSISNKPKTIGKPAPDQLEFTADLCKNLVPKYLSALPVDPLINNEGPIEDCTNPYSTGYTIVINSEDNRITVSAPLAQLGQIVEIAK